MCRNHKLFAELHVLINEVSRALNINGRKTLVQHSFIDTFE